MIRFIITRRRVWRFKICRTGLILGLTGALFLFYGAPQPNLCISTHHLHHHKKIPTKKIQPYNSKKLNLKNIKKLGLTGVLFLFYGLAQLNLPFGTNHLPHHQDQHYHFEYGNLFYEAAQLNLRFSTHHLPHHQNQHYHFEYGNLFYGPAQLNLRFITPSSSNSSSPQSPIRHYHFQYPVMASLAF